MKNEQFTFFSPLQILPSNTEALNSYLGLSALSKLFFFICLILTENCLERKSGTPSGFFMVFTYSTLIYTAESILCSTICVHSATWHNIHMYPYFLFAAIHQLIVPDFLVRPRCSVARATVDLIQGS